MYATTILSVALFAVQAFAGPLAAVPESAQLARRTGTTLAEVDNFKNMVPAKCNTACTTTIAAGEKCAKTPNAPLSCGCDSPAFLSDAAGCFSCILGSNPDKQTQAHFQSILDISKDVCDDAGFEHFAVTATIPPDASRTQQLVIPTASQVGTPAHPNGASISAAGSSLAALAGVAVAAMLL